MTTLARAAVLHDEVVMAVATVNTVIGVELVNAMAVDLVKAMFVSQTVSAYFMVA